MKRLTSSNAYVAVVFAIAAIAVVAPALASHGSAGAVATRTAAAPRGTTPSPAAAARVATAANPNGQVVSLWTARSPGGVECQYLQFDGQSAASTLHNGDHYPPCSLAQQAQPLTIHVGWSLNDDGTYSVGFNGSAAPSSGIVSIVFHQSTPVAGFAARAGDYVGSFDNVPASGALPPGSYSVDGLGADGRVISHIDLAAFLHQALGPR